MKHPIYLDSHATTPVDQHVLDAMLPFFTEHFGNAASLDHAYGSEASEAVEKARQQIARYINASPKDIIFTSGATESNNIAILGITAKDPNKNHVITCSTEHKSILDTCRHLQNIGREVTYISVDNEGKIDLESLEQAITRRTGLITVMTANNEVGTIAPIAEIGDIAHKSGVPFHTDAAQAAGHIPLDVEKMKIDLMSISGHKMYGPKGIGVLYFRHDRIDAKPWPLFFGGGHEYGIRSGTLNVPCIVGLAKAFEIGVNSMDKEKNKFRKWTTNMLNILKDKARPVELNGHPIERLPHNLNISIDGVEHKKLVGLLRNKLAFSSGSACNTLDAEPSYVILAMGFSAERAYTAVRFGLSRFNTDEEINYATDLIVHAVKKLRNNGRNFMTYAKQKTQIIDNPIKIMRNAT